MSNPMTRYSKSGCNSHIHASSMPGSISMYFRRSSKVRIMYVYMIIYIYIFIFSGRVDFSISYVAIFYPKREHVRPESCLPDMWIAQILEFPCPKKDHSAIEERTGHPNLTSAVCIVPLFCCWLSPCCRLIPWDFRTELLLACGRNV